ncbi:MAG: phytanoyl-CoA dioxygenase family protein [Chloroflexi bacterium]|nr:phytanoyl-CoA dioxygenase family protein [Chloroflexota bacterium]
MEEHDKMFICANDLLADPARLRQMMHENGYLFLKQVAPHQKLLKLREDVLTLCAEAGWVNMDPSSGDARWNGSGPFTEGESEYMAVYRRIIHLESFKAVPEDAALKQVMSIIVGGPVLLHQRKIGRVTFPSNVAQTVAAHQDFHYIRGTPETYTMWLPAGDCPRELGGLAVLRGSHLAGHIEHTNFSMKKYASSGLTEQQWPQGEGFEWHAGDFQLGDALIFHSYCIHKALPNLTKDQLRISIDNRYQPANEKFEPGSMETHYNL